MEVIKCDVCNGALEMEAGGRTATCVVCGMRYSVERLQEKLCATQNFEGGINVGNIKISEDAEQLKTLLVKYLDSFDYNNALHIINRILEAAPTDAEANKIYDRLQELKYFEIKNKVLVKYSGTSKEVVIPDGVTEIAKFAFTVRLNKYGSPEDGADVEKLILSDTVTTIGEYAFGQCKKLKEIVWGKQISEIGSSAFASTALTEIEIPSTVKIIGKGAFSGCESLTKIVLPDGIEELGVHSFSNSAVKMVEFSNSIKRIGDWCFYRTAIEKIAIPDSVIEIGASAFSSCMKLSKVTLGENIKIIGESAFASTQITEIVIPLSVTTIGEDGFAYCEKLLDVKILNPNLDVDEYNVFGSSLYLDEKNKREWEQREREEAERERRKQEEARQEDLRRKAGRRQQGVCQYCGGTFSGLFTKKCSNCGRVKDY